MRSAKIERNTKETQIWLEINLDGSGKSSVNTGIGFFDHMLNAFAKHGSVDLEIKANGDLEIDQHHLVEDAGIVLGEAVAKALGDKRGIRRAGCFAFPMDESIAFVSLDLSNRAYLTFDCKFEREKIGELESDMPREFFAGFSQGARCNLFVRLLYGENDHHKCESIFKGFGKALAQAVSVNERGMEEIPSTKGVI